jgi:hypothetical protein
MLTIRSYPLADEGFEVLVRFEVARLGGDPQSHELEFNLRGHWPDVRVIRVEPTSRHYDPILFAFRDGHVGRRNAPALVGRPN